MFIESIKYKLPSKKISNEEIIARIRKTSEPFFVGREEELEKVIESINYYFDRSGSENRNYLNENEKPIGLLKEAFNEAIEEAGWKKEEIELLIYVGVCRGFVEPGGAYITADALGIHKAHCFDIIDACMSWTRALFIVRQFLKLGVYKKVAIVNAEFNCLYLEKDMYDIRSEEQVDYSFPALTLGEGASVTLVSDKIDTPWRFEFWSGPQYAELCTIPNDNYHLFTDNPSDKIGKRGPMHFTSYGKIMHTVGAPIGIGLYQKLGLNRDKIDIVFTHASASKIWHKLGEFVGIADKMYHIYPKTGNLASASIPTSMAMAIEDNKLKRGDSTIFWVGSAGASGAVVHFNF